MQHQSVDTTRRIILAENIKTYVDASFYSTENLAKILGITSRHLRRYKNGISEPPATVLFSLCKVLNVDIHRMLMTDTEWYAFIHDTV